MGNGKEGGVGGLDRGEGGGEGGREGWSRGRRDSVKEQG